MLGKWFTICSPGGREEGREEGRGRKTDSGKKREGEISHCVWGELVNGASF